MGGFPSAYWLPVTSTLCLSGRPATSRGTSCRRPVLIFLIAALHALPIFVVAWNSSNRAWVWLVAAISAVVAVVTGNPTYAAADLRAIAIALWNCLEVIKRRETNEPPREVIAPPEPKTAESVSGWGWAVVLFAALAFIFFQPSRGPLGPSASVATPMPPTANTLPPIVVPRPVAQKAGDISRTPAIPRTRLTAEQCLRMADERKMVRCLEIAK